MELRIKKLHPDAKVLTFAHPGDAGMDLCALAATIILPGGRTSVATGIAMAIPAGYVGLIWDKSGISHKTGVKVLGGVIDAGYRGEVMVGLVNTGTETCAFNAGDKLAQLLIQKVEHPDLIEVVELDDTKRGTGAFGSTGQ